MVRMRDDGCVYAFSRADGNAYAMQRSEYPQLLADWMAGKAFFTGIGFYGQKLTLKLGDVVAIEENTPESLAAARADKAADEREDAIE